MEPNLRNKYSLFAIFFSLYRVHRDPRERREDYDGIPNERMERKKHRQYDHKERRNVLDASGAGPSRESEKADEHRRSRGL